MSAKERRILEEHGTQLMAMKPSSIWQAAMEDLKRRAFNAVVTKNGDGNYRQYAFPRDHVSKASTANDVIRFAIANPGLGQNSGKRDTRLIYSDIELLKLALR